MKKIGLITYHSAYNYGSVLQAYATQKAVDKIGYSTEIINYRMDKQKKYYQTLYRTSFGLRFLLKDLLQLPISSKRKIRNEKFEKFITKFLCLSDEVNTSEDAIHLIDNYDVVISGSDQIWNFHSNELMNQPFDAIKPYLLAGYKGIKISYASSIGNMNDKELGKIIDYVREFNAISFREKSSLKKVYELFGVSSINVPDPTFLLDCEEWVNLLNLNSNVDDEYIFYYSLGGPKIQKRRINNLISLARKKKLKVKVVTPFAYIPGNSDVLENHPEYGPEDFLTTILNAKMIITDSYHGSILSINFEKDLYSLCENGGSEFRKTDILGKLEMKDRIINSIDEISNRKYSPIDYTMVKEKMESFRKVGIDYLYNSLLEH